MKIFGLILLVAVAVYAQPPFERDDQPEPYDYQYKVENPPTNTFFGRNENGDQLGRVTGSYYVWLPDGRLMTVEYYVDGESGFVPKVSYQDNFAPNQGSK